jgi:hypothetical protein
MKPVTDSQFAELQKLASRRRTRLLLLDDGSVAWFPGGYRIHGDLPGMSYATAKRWLLTPARQRPIDFDADGEPLWGTR